MSLQVWLPLNGNLNNQGLGNITITSGNPTYKNGKVTSKSLNLNQRIYFTCPQLANLQTFSVCFWGVTENSSTLTTNWQDLIGFTDVSSSGTNGTFRWETCYGSTGTLNGIHWHDNATNALVNGSVYHNISRNEWCHCCVVFDAEHRKIYSYSNGELKGTHTHLGGHFNASGKFYLGETNNIEGRIQDVRFYDHALSPKEVKEISKGLVLHYRLAGPGQENLVPNSNYNNYTATPNSAGASLDSSVLWNGMPTLKLSQSGNTTNVYRGFSVNILNSLTKGEKYTMTVYAYVKDKSLLDSGMEVRIYQRRANGASTLWGNLRYSLVNNSWVKIQGTYTIDTNATSAVVNMQIVKNGTVWFSPVKVEKGSIATPWCPNPADALYSALGYNNNIEYDCSGYSNNGTKSGTIICDSDTPRYMTSYKFTGSQHITAGRGAMVTDAITVSWWGYMDNWSNYTRAISCTESGGWNFEPNSGKMAFPLYRNGQYIHAIDTVALSSYSGWHHFAATYDGYKSRIYVDGILKVTSEETTTKYPIVYNTTNGIFIAAEAGGSASTPIDTKFNGKLSDIRIYATALSEADIKELYNTSFIIDNTGKAYAYEYIEAN